MPGRPSDNDRKARLDQTLALRARAFRRMPARWRRGIASVLSMMFLIMFGSLVAAMAVTTTGNIRTATMHLHVMRAMSAAETGLEIAEARLEEATSRFVVEEGEIDAAFTEAFWEGDQEGMGGSATITVLAPPSGYAEGGDPRGLAEAIRNHFDADTNIIIGGEFITDPVIDDAPEGTDNAVYLQNNWLYTPAVALEAPEDGAPVPPPAFQIRYAPLAGGEFIRIFADGIVFNYDRDGEPIRRTLSRDYRITKSVDQAIISQSRILIGKNVQIEGDMGARFDQVTFDNGDPLVIRSDFEGMDATLDEKLARFWAAVAAADVDDDNRLRFGHPVEGAGLPADDDFDGSGDNDGAFGDATGDGFLDEMDVFINHYDANNDNRVTLSDPLTVGTPAELFAAEFVNPDGSPVDDDLAYLIDASIPDRNRNNVFGFDDVDNDSIWDAGTETLNDFDDRTGTFPDRELGWRDGFIDALDQYAKVRGSLTFRVEADDWNANEPGGFRPELTGPIVPGEGDPPLTFGAGDDVLPAIDPARFNATTNEIMAAADGDAFWAQAAGELGVSVADLATWTEASNPADAALPSFVPLYGDADNDGLPDNSAWAHWEISPFNSPQPADVYFRPVFRNMTFRNVQIPVGLNALFENCTFVGSTYVRITPDNTHPLWTEYGAITFNPAGAPVPKYPRYVYGDDGSEPAADASAALPPSARPPNANVLMTLPSVSPLDKGDVLESEKAFLTGISYDDMPDPLIVDGNRIVDTKALSNNLRFHDCLFVGSIVSDTPVNYTQVRNKIQFTGATRFTLEHPEEPANGFLNPDPADLEDLAKSSMMLPNLSVDVGTFNSPPTQNVTLQGAIIAGVLDARGNTTIDGALLLTFSPTPGTPPLVDAFGNTVGNPAFFNASLGYFGEDAGDFESIDPSTLPIVGGVPIVGWDTTVPPDGIADVGSDQAQPAGSVAVPFFGYGRITIRHNPDMVLPSGIPLPLKARPVPGTYSEGER
ncbi:MAG: hypothetical protein AAF356_03745 [Planctomycetota bacterium]